MGSLYCQCDSSPENTSPLSLESSAACFTSLHAMHHCAWWCKARMQKALYALFLSYFEGGDLRLRQSRSLVCPDLRFRAEQVSELVVEVEVGTTIEEAWRALLRNIYSHTSILSNMNAHNRTVRPDGHISCVLLHSTSSVLLLHHQQHQKKNLYAPFCLFFHLSDYEQQ